MFVIYRPGDEETARHVNVLLEDHSGAIWCGTNRGMYQLEQIDNRVSFRFVDLGMPSKTYGDTIVTAIVEDRRGTLWVGTQSSGLYRHWPDGHTDRYTTRNGLPENLITSLLQDREARLWVGTRQGLCELVAEPDLTQPIVARVYTSKDGLPGSNHIESLFQSSDGRLWVGGYGGLSEFISQDNQANQTFRTYTTAQGLTFGIGALAEDRDGNIWMAGDGVMKLARTGFTSFGEADGIGDPVIASIFDNQGLKHLRRKLLSRRKASAAAHLPLSSYETFRWLAPIGSARAGLQKRSQSRYRRVNLRKA